MLTVFWGVEGFFLLEFLPKSKKFNKEYACELLVKLDLNINNSSRGGLNRYLFHWDNARPHTAQLTKEKLESLGASVLPHPPYSPDLAPSDFYLFGNLKRQLEGVKFGSAIQLMNKIVEITSLISYDERMLVFLEWIRRLTVISNSDGDYYF